MMRVWTVLFLGAMSTTILQAASRQDLLDFEDDADSSNSNRKTKRITDDQVIYTTSQSYDNPNAPKLELGRLRMDTPGRSLPQRSGKVLGVLKMNSTFKILRTSKDNRWFAIESNDAIPRRYWVPQGTIEKMKITGHDKPKQP